MTRATEDKVVAKKSIMDGRSNKKSTRILRLLLFLPYILAPIWTCLHPVISILTGEMKCRGWYLDEHSIETRFVDGQNPNEIPSHLENLGSARPLSSSSRTVSNNIDNHSSGTLSICDFFESNGDPNYNPNSLICHSHDGYFDVVMIKPLSNAVDATEEAVVLVVPSPKSIYLSGEENNLDWGTSRLHQALIQSIKHLADPVGTPWLAKSVFVVTPTIGKTSKHGDRGSLLDETVSSFLDAYLGQQEIPRDYQIHRQQKQRRYQKEGQMPQLPLALSGAILRNLLVLQIFHESPNDIKNATKNKKKNYDRSTDLAILPQSTRGVLPNADLVFLVGQLMQRTNFFKTATEKTFLTHPYRNLSKDATDWINRKIDGMGLDKKRTIELKTWARGMIDMSLFARTLAIGPVPPHAPALDRGIDSLTIRVAFNGIDNFRRDPIVEFVQYTEYLVRSLSNLHERLHHSFTLYLLPTPKKFVSHIEYLLPNILLLLPLAVRAFGFLLPAMKSGLDLGVVGGVLLILVFVAIIMFLLDIITQTTTAALLILYAGVAIFWIQRILRRKSNQPNCVDSEIAETETDSVARKIRTLQFIACVIAVHILVPIAFANASLAYLPSLLWSPLFAFWDYSSMKRSGTGNWFVNHVTILIFSLVVLITATPSFLIPNIFSSYTPFVQFAYVPLHVLFFLLVISITMS